MTSGGFLFVTPAGSGKDAYPQGDTKKKVRDEHTDANLSRLTPETAEMSDCHRLLSDSVGRQLALPEICIA